MSTILDAVATINSHRYRLVSDDPYTPRSYSKWCLMCGDEWPCAPRTAAQSLLRLAEQLVANYEAAQSCQP